MELRKLDKSVLKLWYIHRVSVILPLILGAEIIICNLISSVPFEVLFAAEVIILLLFGIALIMPALRYKMYAWGYDDKRIIVKQGVVFRRRVVIPVCQIQDLHRTQGPLMMMFKLSGVTISTAGSNFDISTLTTGEADRMIDELEHNLETRVEEHKNEKI